MSPIETGQSKFVNWDKKKGLSNIHQPQTLVEKNFVSSYQKIYFPYNYGNIFSIGLLGEAVLINSLTPLATCLPVSIILFRPALSHSLEIGEEGEKGEETTRLMISISSSGAHGWRELN